ncbi:MAG: T9SS type A sorting domain-containing protein [Bacteroidales bacterium]|nr:T9SS type A sorting domain-containing protein [Bacteroidales bacterium]
MRNLKKGIIFRSILVIICITVLIPVIFNLFDSNKTNLNPKQHPSEWMGMQRFYPYDKIKPEVWKDAVSQMIQLKNERNTKGEGWEFAGPTNIGGRITDLEIHPSDPDIMYIAAASGGVLKSYDAGQNWVNTFKDVPVISVGDIALDPTNPNVIYAGTGEANASSFSFFGNGIYKSTNGGDTWSHMGLENSVYIGRIIVDYNNPQRIFTAACGNLFSYTDQRGIYRSNDGGSSWERVLYLSDSTSGVDIVQHPENPQILYASMWERTRGLNYRNSFGETSGIWKTINGGDTWTELTNGLPYGWEVGRIGIDISKSNPQVLYAVYDSPSGEVKVYKTSDGGNNWTRTNDSALFGMFSNFGWYFGQIRIDPTDENRVFVMGVYLYRTENGGQSWSESWDAGLHVDHHAMHFHPLTGQITEGNDGGLYKSYNNGTNWTKINNLPITQFYAMAIDYLQPERLYGGTQDNNTIRTKTGALNDWDAILGGDGMYTLVDYTNSDIIYAEYQWGKLHRSNTGGNNMMYIANPMTNDRVNWSAPLAMDPNDSKILYFGTYRIWKSTNRGDSWTAISNDLTQGGSSSLHTLSTIAISNINPAIIYAGTCDGKAHVSSNGGQTWTNISLGLPNRWITRLAPDEHDASTVYASLSGFRWEESLPHVFKSTDMGATWVSISSNLPEFPVNIIVVDPMVPGRLFVGTDAGVYSTTNDGEEWGWAWSNLPAVPVIDLKIHNSTRKIVAATYGLSMYKANIDQLSIGIKDQKNILDFKISPNPARNFCRITIPDNQRKDIQIRISRIDGSFITRLKLKNNSQFIDWDLTSSSGQKLPSGMYLISVSSADAHNSKKIMLL